MVDNLRAIAVVLVFFVSWFAITVSYGLAGFAIGWLPAIIIGLTAGEIGEYLIAMMVVVAALTAKFWM